MGRTKDRQNDPTLERISTGRLKEKRGQHLRWVNYYRRRAYAIEKELQRRGEM